MSREKNCRKLFYVKFLSFWKKPENLNGNFSITSELDEKPRQVWQNCIPRVQRRSLRQLHFGKKCLVSFYGFWGTQFSNKLSRSSWLGSEKTFHVSGATFWTSFFERINSYRVSPSLCFQRKFSGEWEQILSRSVKAAFLVPKKNILQYNFQQKTIFNCFRPMNKNCRILAEKFDSLVKAAFDVTRRDMWGKCFFPYLSSKTPRFWE